MLVFSFSFLFHVPFWASKGDRTELFGNDRTGFRSAFCVRRAGHPLRQLPFVSRLMPADSVKMLRAAVHMREQGRIPGTVRLWAVENPNLPADQSLERLQRKVTSQAAHG